MDLKTYLLLSGGKRLPSVVPIATLPWLKGRFFADTVIEATDFSLFKRYLDKDPTAEAVRDQRRILGYNMLRVWLLNKSVVINGGIDPRDYPMFYLRLREFIAWLGMNVELTVFTSTQLLMPDRAEQQRHLDNTATAVRGLPNVILELANEIDVTGWGNAPDPALTRPTGVTISRGSNGADSDPPNHGSPWDYECYHTNDRPQFQRKVGHNAMEYADTTGRPCIANENTRFTDRDNNAIHAYDAAMGGALLCAGSCYHSQAGKTSSLWEGGELACAKAWVAGARSVPLEFRAGAYNHYPQLEGADCIRAYSRRLADGREYIIRIRP